MDLAWQIGDLRLTKRLNQAQLNALQSSIAGEKSWRALLALADASEFLDPPHMEIPATAAPGFTVQR